MSVYHIQPITPLSTAARKAVRAWFGRMPFGAILRHRSRYRRWPLINGGPEDTPPGAPGMRAGRAA